MIESNWINFYFSFELKVFSFLLVFFSVHTLFCCCPCMYAKGLHWVESSMATRNPKCDPVIHIHIDIVCKLQISSVSLFFRLLENLISSFLCPAAWQSAYVYMLVFSINLKENEVKSIYSADKWKCKLFHAFTFLTRPPPLSFWIDGYR